MMSVTFCAIISKSFLLSSIISMVIAIDIMSITTTTAAATGIRFMNESDRDVLLVIKDLIPGNPRNVFSSWNNSVHFCHWQGVTCGLRHQRVVALRLLSLGLMGSLSPQIGNLSFLRVIDLRNNSFQGTIPEEIGKLFRLRTLVLSNNSFNGEIPANLSRCARINTIDLSGNNLQGQIPAELGSLSNLYYLSLESNQFAGNIPPSLGNLSTLQTLSLYNNKIEGSIPVEFAKLSNLGFLQLGFNNLSGNVPSGLYNASSNIYHFSLVSNALRGRLPPDLGLALPKLKWFSVGINQFDGPIPSSIANASQLAVISLTTNAFTGPLPMSFGHLQRLTTLYAGSNNLEAGNNELARFLDSLTNCSDLQGLDLSYNSLQGSLPESIGNFSANLTQLLLARNNISGLLPLSTGNLFNLRVLALQGNMLAGGIPESIGGLSSLQGLYLHNNNFSREIPSSIGNLSALSMVGLEENMLEGKVPTSLGNCTNLQGLDLGYNLLTGAIPIEIMGLSSLSFALSFQFNSITGEIPEEVGNLKNLEQLYLSGNKLSGKIPATIGSCQVLESLFMDGNLLEGTIPESFEQIKGLQVLDLSRNNLSGQIPKILADLPIRFLNLSSNMFEGEVPTEGVFRNISAFSIEKNNKLCGGIEALKLPACPARAMEKNKRKSLNIKVIVRLVIVVVMVLLLIIGISIVIYRRRRSQLQASSASPLEEQYPKLSYAELLQATNGFSSTNLIGQGRYGSVYKATLVSNERQDNIVAVKVLDLQQHGASKSFVAECNALKTIRHRNLVKIITSCSSIDFQGLDFKALVFEYMPNGNLENWIHSDSSRILKLAQRVNIVIDVASALDYLHHHSETVIVHCDLKPSNILLDDDLCAHVGDFGLAKILSTPIDGSNNHESSSIGVRGTVGYVAPEYGMGAEISTLGDMYSYGILLLEIFTKRRPTDSIFTDNFSLHGYVKAVLPDRVMEVVDPDIMLPEENESTRSTQANPTNIIEKIQACVASILQIGVSCSADQPSHRMDVRDALEELNRVRNVLLGTKRQGRRDQRRNIP